MGTGRVIILISVAIFVILFFTDLFIAIYQHDKYEPNKDDFNDDKEINEFVREWCAENTRKEKKKKAR